jgi:hypothetical protein
VSAGGGGSTGHNPLPHDLAQLVVERELGLPFGFWGAVAAGATFRTLVAGGRKRTRPGVAVIRAHVEEIDEAEHLFHRHVDNWLRGQSTPAKDALDEALARWQAIDEHQSIELEFPCDQVTGKKRRRRNGSRPRL